MAATSLPETLCLWGTSIALAGIGLPFLCRLSGQAPSKMVKTIGKTASTVGAYVAAVGVIGCILTSEPRTRVVAISARHRHDLIIDDLLYLCAPVLLVESLVFGICTRFPHNPKKPLNEIPLIVLL